MLVLLQIFEQLLIRYMGITIRKLLDTLNPKLIKLEINYKGKLRIR